MANLDAYKVIHGLPWLPWKYTFGFPTDPIQLLTLSMKKVISTKTNQCWYPSFSKSERELPHLQPQGKGPPAVWRPSRT